ncbi:hypothetical protein [Nocardiopsis chromatogenes]|uniref:hypothetical protein n=1 Tax=Nocardiopsis chromatogenes TaxID=280239 RepID=UPI0012678C49|nr:hypothetical protein [Nocardiopsis chromatogenes]
MGKSKDITIRVMQGSKGNAREGETCYRVSVGDKGAVDRNGDPTSDREASQIDMDGNALSEIEKIVDKYKK